MTPSSQGLEPATFPERFIPFICECAEERCSELVRLTLEEYEQVRANPRWFINAPGHHVNGAGWARIVETTAITPLSRSKAKRVRSPKNLTRGKRSSR